MQHSRFRIRHSPGVSLIEVLAAIVVLMVGIWALVTIFPAGERAIKRQDARELAHRLASEVLTEFTVNPDRIPAAIIPVDSNFDNGASIMDTPFLQEPPRLLQVRRHIASVIGERLTDQDGDGKYGEDPPGDANGDGNADDDLDGKVDEDGGKMLLNFPPVASLNRLYKEVPYERWRQGIDPPLWHYKYPASSGLSNQIQLPDEPRVRSFQVDYVVTISGQPFFRRERYKVPSGNILQLAFSSAIPSSNVEIIQVVEEYDLNLGLVGWDGNSGVIIALSALSALPPEVKNAKGALRADYTINTDKGGPWITETTALVAAKPGNPPEARLLFRPFWNDSSTPALDAPAVRIEPATYDVLTPTNWDQKQGVLFFDPAQAAMGNRIRAAYRIASEPTNNLLIDWWWHQLLFPPATFTPVSEGGAGPLIEEPWRQYQLLGSNLLRLRAMHVGHRVSVDYVATDGSRIEDEVQEVNWDAANKAGLVSLSRPYAYITAVRGVSVIVRVSGQRLGLVRDFVDLSTLRFKKKFEGRARTVLVQMKGMASRGGSSP